MEKRIQKNFRMDPRLAQQLEVFAPHAGKDMTQVVHEALVEYLDQPERRRVLEEFNCAGGVAVVGPAAALAAQAAKRARKNTKS